MQIENLIAIATAVSTVWLAVLTFVIFRSISHYKKLVNSAKGSDLKKLLDGILKVQKGNSQEIKKIKDNILALEKDGKFHLQKVAVNRYNPFTGTGGDHSFSIALLDAKDSGFLLTGLHTRERTRVYIKPVESGESRYELSKEEKEAIKKAKNK